MINIKIQIIIVIIMSSGCAVPFDVKKITDQDDPMYNCNFGISVWCVVKGKEPETIEPQQNIDKQWCEQVFIDRSNFSVIDKKGYVYETYCRKYEQPKP